MRGKISIFLMVSLIVSLCVVAALAKKENNTEFARVTISQVKIDKVDEAIKLYTESVVPAAKSQKGFRGIILLSDREKGKSISISFWDSEEDAIANEQSGYYKKQVDKFKEFYTALPVQEGYEVTIKE